MNTVEQLKQNSHLPGPRANLETVDFSWRQIDWGHQRRALRQAADIRRSRRALAGIF